jgi:glycosyltransferase involved in cell wall biosynthesis
MRIAQIAPLFESVPPKTYGGTERVVSYLTEELIYQGHEVTLFASGDSETKAKLYPCVTEALRLGNGMHDEVALHILQLESVMGIADEFDILHFHTNYLNFPFSSRIRKPSVTTLHGRLDIAEWPLLVQRFPTRPLVSISHAQREPIPNAYWVGNVHHGLPDHLYEFYPDEGKYLAFLGRISPEKRIDRAIEIAKICKIPLKIAAKIDRSDLEYFNREIAHLLDHPLIEYIGEIGEEEKGPFLGNALALLFPIDWPEPFGMVMIEALACGTPVVAFQGGSVPEVIRGKEYGRIVSSIDEAVQAVYQIHSIDRIACRDAFETLFSARRMANEYVHVYEDLIRHQSLFDLKQSRELSAS